MPGENIIREAIANCRRAGTEKRFQDAIHYADNAIFTASERPADPQYLRLRAVALSYKGMAHFQMKQFRESVLALEDAYRIFQEHPPTNTMQLLEKVELSLVQVCSILHKDPPLPPLLKFPRTSHLFRPTDSKAVTEDDLVLDKDDAMFKILASNDASTHVSMEEKIDGANLGLSLSLDGEILVQNRSHYISKGEHAQFSQLAAWTAMHRDEIKRILEPESWNERARRVLYGEWVVAKHSICYERLPAYFLAFDLLDGDRFVSRRRFHSIMHGSGIPVSPTLETPDLVGLPQKEIEAALMAMLDTPSQFRSDGGPIEGIVFRVDEGDWTQHRCKLVRPDFTAGITGHWMKSKIEKQRIDANFASAYLERCYHHAEGGNAEIPEEVGNPRHRADVTYERNGDDEEAFTATASVSPREPSAKLPAIRPPREGTIVLPRNLCWLWRDEVLVSSTPKSSPQILAMHDALNIGLVITLTEEEPLPSQWIPESCENYFRPVTDGMAPTVQAMDDIGDDIVRAISNGSAVLEHCGGGQGRAGAVAACLLLRFGRDGIRARIESENSDGNNASRILRPRTPFMTSEEAIAEVRRRRPGSLETSIQENFVREYAQHLWRLAAKMEMLFDEDSPVQNSDDDNGDTSSAKKSTRKRRVPKYVVLGGLPGSGKSSLARTLKEDGQSACNRQWMCVSTDELGRKEAFDSVGRIAARVGQGKLGGIVVDACNTTARHRREWYETMHQPDKGSASLVFFDLPVELCEVRVRCRVDHPTIPFGRGDTVVRAFARNLELPSEMESDIFGSIEVLRSKEDLDALLNKWGLAP